MADNKPVWEDTKPWEPPYNPLRVFFSDTITEAQTTVLEVALQVHVHPWRDNTQEMWDTLEQHLRDGGEVRIFADKDAQMPAFLASRCVYLGTYSAHERANNL